MGCGGLGPLKGGSAAKGRRVGGDTLEEGGQRGERHVTTGLHLQAAAHPADRRQCGSFQVVGLLLVVKIDRQTIRDGSSWQPQFEETNLCRMGSAPAGQLLLVAGVQEAGVQQQDRAIVAAVPDAPPHRLI